MENWSVEVFFDGECPLCVREIGMLRRMDRRGDIRFTDITAPEFDATSFGRTQAEFMASIQGRTADGRWMEGVEVFRHLYTSVGFGWLVKLTRFRPLASFLDVAYAWFAKRRLKWTGRAACVSGACDRDVG